MNNLREGIIKVISNCDLDIMLGKTIFLVQIHNFMDGEMHEV